jgi:hypothetical protein
VAPRRRSAPLGAVVLRNRPGFGIKLCDVPQQHLLQGLAGGMLDKRTADVRRSPVNSHAHAVAVA